ncbi:MAG TPA: MoaD/ThiS family protein [Proteobacteria bacterium]|nr:MoaD/ThiS family protein [Pseudomonadota bacterium]
MKIQVNLYGVFRSVAPSPSFSREAVEGTTVKDLMESLQLPDTVYRMALVNDIRVKEGTILKDGDEVHIFQPVGGG